MTSMFRNQPKAVQAVGFACVIAFMGIGLAHLRTWRARTRRRRPAS